jgi:hypothetical protein
MNDYSQFGIWDWKGFHITFANGVDVSVQFGIGSYTDNYLQDDLLENWNSAKGVIDGKTVYVYRSMERQNITSTTAEVAILKNGKFITQQYMKDIDPEYDEAVLAHITPDQLIYILFWAKNLKYGSRYGSNPLRY